MAIAAIQRIGAVLVIGRLRRSCTGGRQAQVTNGTGRFALRRSGRGAKVRVHAGAGDGPMAFTIATWNINSVRLREALVLQYLAAEAPDILCLQECKSPVENIPLAGFQALGYRYLVARGQKGYNGVAILSKLPIMDAGDKDFAQLGHARHVAARLENGVTIHNFYVPAGGDIPDRAVNEKFGQKLDFLTEMRDHFRWERPDRAILVGDLNIAPREDDVWSHKQLLKIVSHTPIEVEHLGAAQDAGAWVDVTRQDIPAGQLYSWWSYRSSDWDAADKGRRLDHVWATPDIAGAAHSSRILRAVRGWDGPSDHVPVMATFDL
jgi:exodeoxyribonuclease III